MKYILPFCLMIICLFGSSCKDNERERALAEKEAALDLRATELAQQETALQQREAALQQQIQQTDSARKDTSAKIEPGLTGTWAVRMTCTQTTCPGSSVGDTKTEQWTIAYQGTQIVARAMVGKDLVRRYTGLYTGNTIELVELREGTATGPPTKMIVLLRIVDEQTLEGHREIIREGDCTVIYSVQMTKQQA